MDTGSPPSAPLCPDNHNIDLKSFPILSIEFRTMGNQVGSGETEGEAAAGSTWRNLFPTAECESSSGTDAGSGAGDASGAQSFPGAEGFSDPSQSAPKVAKGRPFPGFFAENSRRIKSALEVHFQDGGTAEFQNQISPNFVVAHNIMLGSQMIPNMNAYVNSLTYMVPERGIELSATYSSIDKSVTGSFKQALFPWFSVEGSLGVLPEPPKAAGGMPGMMGMARQPPPTPSGSGESTKLKFSGKSSSCPTASC